jgi:hypothetical protein
MKKNIFLSAAVFVLLFSSCTKNNDYVKETLEKALPAIEITSMGLTQQVGPFAQSDVIQVTFGGALTGSTAGTFDFAWYDAPATGSPVRVDSVHFDSWNAAASAANGTNAISTTMLTTSYPNTNAFAGSLILKLTKLPAGSKSYTLKLYASTGTNKKATVSVSKFITIK